MAEEGLVIKARRQRLGEKPDHRANIKAQRGPAVLAARDQPFINDHIGRAGVGLFAATFAHGYQRIGFLDARRHDPARAVIFEAAPHQADAIAQQRRRQRIAFARFR